MKYDCAASGANYTNQYEQDSETAWSNQAEVEAAMQELDALVAQTGFEITEIKKGKSKSTEVVIEENPGEISTKVTEAKYLVFTKLKANNDVTAFELAHELVEKFPNELMNDLVVKDGKNANAVTFYNRFIWLQEKLDEEIANGTKVNLSKGGVLSYKKADYDPEVPPNFIDKLVGVSTTEEAGKEIDKMLGDKVFDYPKPVSLLTYMINFVCKPDDIILDFFSGSATTAHAVMQLNAENGGNRKFIMVQLPEVTDEKSEANKVGFKNICEIGKERIRRAGAKIKADSGMFQSSVDTGFKVFKLDDSNLVAWNTTPIKEGDLPELWDRFTALTETIKGNRSELDVVYEVMAKMGVPLTYPVREITVGTKKTYSVGDNNMLLVCLEKGITPEDVEAMCELAPYWIIAAEEAFADDMALSNAHYTVKARNIKMELL